ncbi:D-2-hydroxyacid dehydrogenase family protein [Dactylosporangium sp. NPDC000555]|uniref:D-2-hydroxyacid dehydrogenase family protein n=1 Tax=Dactylosporangium sp. NPDC000555 TaxID=3154260 RepID=UPI003321957D
MSSIPATGLSVAVLDDYQDLAATVADWSPLPAGVRVHVFRTKMTEPDALVAALAEFDVLVVLRERTPMTADLLGRLPKLRLLVTTGPYNAAIDLDAAAANGITVCATRLSMTSTIEFTFALLFEVTRLTGAEDRHMREGGWQLVRPLRPELRGRTLGLVGFGLIGTEVARIATAFGMHVLAWSQNLDPEVARRGGAEPVSRDELFARSDFVSIHTRLSERTRGLVGAHELGLMKPTAYLLNTSRGPIIDEPALVEALHSGSIAGAALDVFCHEPLPMDDPLISAPNVILSPHVAAMTTGHAAAWFTDVVEDINAWIAGRPIRVLSL